MGGGGGGFHTEIPKKTIFTFWDIPTILIFLIIGQHICADSGFLNKGTFGL